MKKLFPFLLVLASCSRIKDIPYAPETTPEQWLQMQSYTEIHLGSFSFILTQPSSTFFIYFLGILTIALGLIFLKKQDKQQSKKWWGIALVLWGLGALSAGTSYQAFGYELKCAGREICCWTSWYEIVYLVLTVASVFSMMIAIAYSNFAEKARKRLIVYSVSLYSIYLLATLYGILTLSWFFISFEFLIVVLGPNILFLFFVNWLDYSKYKKAMDLKLMLIWSSLGGVIALYFVYFLSGVENVLWSKGIWFTANDVLHLALVAWMLYIAYNLPKTLKDFGNDKIS
jgi:hypothetical protein